MRRIHPRSIVKVRTLTSRYDHRPECFKFGRQASSPGAPRRSRRFFSSSVRVSEWTQHSLSNLKPLPTTPKEIVQLPQKAYIAFGSNLGDRIDWIERACTKMSRQGIKILRTSCLWETDPMYMLDQDKFVNGVCEVRFKLTSMHVILTSV